MAAATTPAPTVTVEQVLALCRELVNAHDARHYNAEQCALTLLIDATRALPPWLLPPIVEPAAEVERVLSCGHTYRIANEDGNLVLVIKDEETAVAPAMTRDEATQMRADFARILAAINGGSK